MNPKTCCFAAIVFCVGFSGPLLAKGSGGHGHANLTIKKQVDTASKMMSAKPAKKFKPASNRSDPYKNYKFR